MNNNIERSMAKDDGGIVQIEVARLFHHPDNPRKDLGDVSELAESIKKNGVMQNLTIIPIGFYMPPEEQTSADKIGPESDFHVLIGNRRLEAARLAGVEEVPCRIVSNLDKRQQVSIMLEENMQRSDLTILEQAEGFQMMLDLGDTVEGIKEKTGFSKTTIYHRLNIAKLDKETLEEKERDEGFQLSIGDLNELERIRDIGKRNEVLKQASDGRNLKYLIDNAVRSEGREKRAEKIIEILKGQGMSPAPEGAWDRLYEEYMPVETIDLDVEDCCENVPDAAEYDCPAEELMYLVRYSYLRIIKKMEKEEERETPEEMARKEKEKNKRKITSIMKEMGARKDDFIKGIVNGDIAPIEESAALYIEIWKCMLTLGVEVEKDAIYEFFTEKPIWQLTEEEEEELGQKVDGLTAVQQMLLVMDASATRCDPYKYDGTFDRCDADKIGQIYAILEKYGWSFMEEEAEILDGTHELYAKGDS